MKKTRTPKQKPTEPKLITCAVRLDKPLYDRLVDAANNTHQTLSEVIRAGLIKQLDDVRKETMQKEIEMNSLESELAQVRKLKLEMENLLKNKAM